MRLLAEHDQAGGFLSNPAHTELTAHIPGTLNPGEILDDKFKIVRLIAEGGMGQVWLAEQTVPLRRQVVVKLIKAGMYDDGLIQRFRAERQSLAIMDHPCIAKVFDAGATQIGQPYFVMEYVPGLPITKYCDEKKLSIRARLELFVKVCEGVQHAHQKAIIHRDLKPPNILIVEVDGQPTPRIIDFGIAKATSPFAGAEFTQTGGIVGTPGYMSPEQTDPRIADVDTRTDVYSLGAILYVLLAGSLPIDPKQWRQKPLDEILRHLREDDPPRPSIKVSTGREEATATAEARGMDVKRLMGVLRGDLDCITMKALERDRARRYDTPSELAADIRRYLNNEAVLARPASTIYRIRKYVGRHRVGVAVAAGVVLLLVGSGVVQAVQLRRTARERDRANRERDRATHVTDFMTGMFKVADPSEARGNTITAREILDKASTDIETGLTKDPELQAQMMNIMGNVYYNLGLYPRGQLLQQQSMEIRERVLGPRHPDTLDSMNSLAVVLDDEGHYPEAEKLDRETLEIRNRVLGPEHPDTLGSKNNLANVLDDEGHYPEAEKLYRETLDTRRRVLGPEHRDTLVSTDSLASLLFHEGRSAEAEKLYRETLETQRRVFGPNHPDTLRSMHNLANLLYNGGHLAEAENIDRETLDIQRRVLGPEHPHTLSSANDLANVLNYEGHNAEAERLYRETLATQRRVLGLESRDTLDSMRNLATVLAQEGHYPEAEKLDRETLEIRNRVLGPEHPDTLVTKESLAWVLSEERHYAGAEKLYRETLDIQRRVLGPEHRDTLYSMSTLADVLNHEGHYAEAEKLLRETVDVQRRVLGPEDPETASSTYNLGCLAALQGRRVEALLLLREAVDHGLRAFIDLGLDKDPDLKSLHEDPRFDVLVAHAKERAAAAQKPN